MPYEREGVKLIVREIAPGVATHDLALKVQRAESHDDMHALLAQSIAFYHQYPMNPRAVGTVLTPEEAARIVVQGSVDSLKDEMQRSRWQLVLDAASI